MGGYIFKFEDGHGYIDVVHLFDATEDGHFERMRAALLQRKDRVDDLMDRSKTNLLSRTVAYGQMLWFCANFIGRIVDGLPITKLEVVSLAYVAMTLATYYFWMSKPLDVDCPIVVVAGTQDGFGELSTARYSTRTQFGKLVRRDSGGCIIFIGLLYLAHDAPLPQPK
jgi:hypothetical protein